MILAEIKRGGLFEIAPKLFDVLVGKAALDKLDGTELRPILRQLQYVGEAVDIQLAVAEIQHHQSVLHQLVGYPFVLFGEGALRQLLQRIGLIDRAVARRPGSILVVASFRGGAHRALAERAGRPTLVDLVEARNIQRNIQQLLLVAMERSNRSGAMHVSEAVVHVEGLLEVGGWLGLQVGLLGARLAGWGFDALQ